jgi:hypothetical protein
MAAGENAHSDDRLTDGGGEEEEATGTKTRTIIFEGARRGGESQ